MGLCKTEELLEEYMQLIEPISAKLLSGELTCLPAIAGKDYGSQDGFRLMYVGRCANGWNDFESSNAQEFIEKAFVTAEEFDMSDIAVQKEGKYNFMKSAFWKLCRELCAEYYAETNIENWSDNILWSNLWKIAPADGGNITGADARLIVEQSVALLKKEIEIFKPTHIVFVTGGWIKPGESKTVSFMDIGDFSVDVNSKELILGTGKIKLDDTVIKAVVTQRPENHSNEFINEQAKEILKCLGVK